MPKGYLTNETDNFWSFVPKSKQRNYNLIRFSLPEWLELKENSMGKMLLFLVHTKHTHTWEKNTAIIPLPGGHCARLLETLFRGCCLYGGLWHHRLNTKTSTTWFIVTRPSMDKGSVAPLLIRGDLTFGGPLQIRCLVEWIDVCYSNVSHVWWSMTWCAYFTHHIYRDRVIYDNTSNRLCIQFGRQ